VEAVQSAIELVNDLLERGNFPAAYVDGHRPAAAPVEERVEAATEEEARPEAVVERVTKPKVQARHAAWPFIFLSLRQICVAFPFRRV
jgi:hypothetical protein